LDVNSTTQGLLLPRMTSAKIALIVKPVEGLLVYNTDKHCLMYYDNTTFKCAFAK